MARTLQTDQALSRSVPSAISTDSKQLAIDRSKPGLWTVTFSNPPINLLEPATIVELQALVSEIEMDPVVEGGRVRSRRSGLFHCPLRHLEGG